MMRKRRYPFTSSAGKTLILTEKREKLQHMHPAYCYRTCVLLIITANASCLLLPQMHPAYHHRKCILLSSPQMHPAIITANASCYHHRKCTLLIITAHASCLSSPHMHPAYCYRTHALNIIYIGLRFLFNRSIIHNRRFLRPSSVLASKYAPV